MSICARFTKVMLNMINLLIEICRNLLEIHTFKFIIWDDRATLSFCQEERFSIIIEDLDE